MEGNLEKLLSTFCKLLILSAIYLEIIVFIMSPQFIMFKPSINSKYCNMFINPVASMCRHMRPCAVINGLLKVSNNIVM